MLPDSFSFTRITHRSGFSFKINRKYKKASGSRIRKRFFPFAHRFFKISHCEKCEAFQHQALKLRQKILNRQAVRRFLQSRDGLKRACRVFATSAKELCTRFGRRFPPEGLITLIARRPNNWGARASRFSAKAGITPFTQKICRCASNGGQLRLKLAIITKSNSSKTRRRNV